MLSAQSADGSKAMDTQTPHTPMTEKQVPPVADKQVRKDFVYCCSSCCCCDGALVVVVTVVHAGSCGGGEKNWLEMKVGSGRREDL